jgi:hypothetical protein
MRRYWQPAALIEELPDQRPVRAVRLLGEDLVPTVGDGDLTPALRSGLQRAPPGCGPAAGTWDTKKP